MRVCLLLLVVFESCRMEGALTLNQLLVSIFLITAASASVLEQPVVQLDFNTLCLFKILATCWVVFALESR